MSDKKDRQNSDDWRWLLSHGIQSASDAADAYGEDAKILESVAQGFPVRVNAYYKSLIETKDDPLGKQVIPTGLELEGGTGIQDPLEENADTPVPHLVHRYPDRVLFLVTYQCAIYCRFCTRKRTVGKLPTPTDEELLRGIEYIRRTPQIRDVIVSGGDPFTLSDERLGKILRWLREIPHVEILRVDTRMPCSLPQRVTEALCRELASHHPLYVNTHFNHPREVTAEARAACERLASHGIPVGNQTVLLRNVNDDPKTMQLLVQKLLAARVRPYYLYQCDPVFGTRHLQTSVKEGLRIVASLRGRTSGMGVPTYVIDTPGGGGKVPLSPNRIVEIEDNEVTISDLEGKTFTYTQTPACCAPVK